jgi:hypothetical protein
LLICAGQNLLGDLGGDVTRPALTLIPAGQQVRQDGLPIGLPGVGFAVGLIERPEAVQHQIDRITMVR